jgi:cephalosporin hydroxylase
MTDDRLEFERQTSIRAKRMGEDAELEALTQRWIDAASDHQYTYNFRWLGLPMIQFPQDIVALQELVWTLRPDLIIETGIARGGSLIFYASMLELAGGDGRVIGIDVDIRSHNREAIEAHPLAYRIDMLEGSSTDPHIVEIVSRIALQCDRVLVVLDSNHTYNHVLQELRSYGPLVTRDSYIIVLDTIVERMPDGTFPDRPWGRGDNPMIAVRAFLEQDERFEVDRVIDHRLLISAAPSGYLRCRAGRQHDGK